MNALVEQVNSKIKLVDNIFSFTSNSKRLLNLSYGLRTRNVLGIKLLRFK